MRIKVHQLKRIIKEAVGPSRRKPRSRGSVNRPKPPMGNSSVAYERYAKNVANLNPGLSNEDVWNFVVDEFGWNPRSSRATYLRTQLGLSGGTDSDPDR